MTTPRELLTNSFAALDDTLRAEVSNYLLGAGDHRYPARLDDGARRSIGEIDARTRAPLFLALDQLEDDVLLRLGRLLAVTHPAWWRGPDQVPAAVWALLADATHGTFTKHKLAPKFTTITIERLGRLLALEGVRADAIDGMLLDILIGTTNRSPGYSPRGLQTIPGIAEFATRHSAQLSSQAEGFTLEAHLEVARLASTHPPLAMAMVELLALYTMFADSDVRSAALSALAGVPVETQVAALEPLLKHATGAARGNLIAAIERIPEATAAITLLERALARGGRGAAKLDQAIQRLAIYALADTTTETLIPPFVPFAEHPLDARAVDSMRIALSDLVERKQRALSRYRAARAAQLMKSPGSYVGNNVEQAEGDLAAIERSLESLPAIAAYLSGVGPHPGPEVLEPLMRVGVRERLTGFAAITWARLAVRRGANNAGLPQITGQEDVTDIRATADVLERAGYTREEAEVAILGSAFTETWLEPTLAGGQLWAYMDERPEVFDVVLGITPGDLPVGHGDHRDVALAIMEASPRIAARHLPVVTQLAVGTAKLHRDAAQRVLHKHGVAERVAEEMLRNTATDVRVASALWIERLGGAWAIETLSGRLERERIVAVRATLLGALQRLGGDIRSFLSSAALEAEAIAGLAKGIPAAISWMPLDDLPECRYAVGTPVPPTVLRWWIVLAHSLKDPLGAGLVPLYVRTLDAESAAALGRYVLMAWLARDGARLDDASVLSRAMRAVSRSQANRRMFERLLGVSFAAEMNSVDELELERESRQNVTVTALPDKGILSLAAEVPGAELAEAVRQYLRDNSSKSAHVLAVAQLLSLSEQPEPLHLLVSIARSHKIASVQKAARNLVEGVASSRGWTPDELADRVDPIASPGEN